MQAMIRKEFAQLRRDRRTVAMLVAVPLLMLVVFGFAARFEVDSARTVVDRDLTVGANRRFQHDVFGTGAASATTNGLVDLDDDALVGDLPLGLQRRLAFEVAVAHDPRLLVLDEPTSGVGPLGRARLWEAIGDAAAAGRGVLVTTHHLTEAEQCDRLVVMAAGLVVAEGTVEDVVDGTRTTLVRDASPGPVLTALAAAGLVGALAPGGVGVPDARPTQVRTALREARLEATVTERPATLEERFAVLAAVEHAPGVSVATATTRAAGAGGNEATTGTADTRRGAADPDERPELPTERRQP